MWRAEVAAAAAYVAGCLAVAAVASPFWLYVATGAATTAIVALSVGVIYHRAGLLSLCQMAFAGIGAWTVGWLQLHQELPFLVSMVVAGAMTLVVGVLVGVPALRLRGPNLAVFTLVFNAAVARVVFADGFPGVIEGNRVSPPAFARSDAGTFLLCAATLGIVGILVTGLRQARLGRWWLAVRGSERATAAMGRSVVATKLSAFGVSAGIAGVGGALLAAQNGVVSGASFQPLESMTILTSALMFGAGLFEGALLAGVFARLIPNVLRDLDLPQDIAPLVFAVGGLIALSRGEGGLAAAIRTAIRRARREPRERRAAPGRVLTPIPGVPPAHREQGVGLEVTDVSAHFGAVAALRNVSLRVPPTSVVGVVGPNGAGKSTLIDVVTGFVPPTSGHVLVDGTDMTGLAPQRRARRGIRRTFQRGLTIADLRIGEYLQLAGGRRLTDASIGFAADHFGLPPLDRRIGSVDVVTRRLVEVCGVVLSHPRVALLDEPAAGLSGADRDHFMRSIAAAPAAFDCAVLIVEHDLELVREVCESLVVLDFGAVIASGRPDTALDDRRVVEAYLGAEPIGEAWPERPGAEGAKSEKNSVVALGGVAAEDGQT